MIFDYTKCGDCLELMKEIPDQSIDMILCDLPYGTTRAKWDISIPLNALWYQYERIIKENGAIVLFGDGLFTANLLTSNPKLWRYNLVWNKKKGTDFLNANVKPLKCHEDIAVFYKKKPTYNKQMWYDKPYKLRGGKTKSALWGKYEESISESLDGERYPLTVLTFPKHNERFHATQKPIELIEYLIKTYTNEGDVVLDNCMGSGSTCVAAINTRRHYIGLELERKYFDIANERINEAREVQSAI